MAVKEIVKPIILQRADPWIYKHTDGYYYFTASVPEYDRIEIRRSKTINGLAESEAVTVWRKHKEGMLSANIWAPEIHYIDGKWYVYFAAARTTETKEGLFDHRIFVLENESENPLEGSWVEKGQLKTNWESFALDATTFEHKGIRYLVWAQKDPNICGNSNLYIAKMSNPWTIEGKQVMITEPEYDWEKIGFLVNEGPAVINRNGKIFISYSASATDFNYCMGVLIADENSDEEKEIYGPGHSCFTVSEDGKTDMLVYHARNYKDIVGDPLYDPNRHTFIKKLSYDNNGNIIFS